jgi:UDP-glucose 4-epimerase
MKALITGATGRVGSRLAQALIARGDHVRTLVLPDDPNAEKAQKMGVECLTGSITNLDDALRACEGVDTVVHLAALILFFQKDRPILWDINVQGTYHVFEAAVRVAKRPLRMIFAASDQVYPGTHPLYRPIDEVHPRLPNTFYGLSKVIGEEMLRFYGRTEKDVNISITRFTHTEAPEELIDPNGFFARRLFFVNGRLNYLKEGGSTDPKVLKTIAALEPLAAPDEPLLLARDPEGNPYYQELTDVRDIVQGLLLILDKPEAIGEGFNLTPPTVVNMAEFIPYMAEATGRRYVEARLFTDMPKCHTSGAKARAILGYNPKYTMFDMIDEAVGRNRAGK